MTISAGFPLDLQLIFNAAPGLLLVLAPDNPQFTVVAATDAYLRATHTERSAILGRPCAAVLAEILVEIASDQPGKPEHSAAQALHASLERALALRQPDTLAQLRGHIAKAQAAGGGFDERHWQAVNTPVMDASGRVAYLIHSALDVTESVRSMREGELAQAALRASEAFGRSVLKSSPDCIKVLDLDGKLLSMPTGQSLLGIEDIQPFINKSWIDFWEGADDVQAARAAIQSAAAGGAGRFVGFFRMFGGAPKWWDVAISPILNAGGQPERLLAVSRDVTQRQQAEFVLRERTAQFESLLNAAPLGAYLIDADFCIRLVNRSARPTFGAIPELIGRDFGEVLHILWPLKRAEENIKLFRHTLETGEPCHVPEMIEQRADRAGFEYYEWQIDRIMLPDGRYGVVCYFRDISERVLAQQKIRDAEWRMRYATESARLSYVEVDLASGVAQTPDNFASVMGYAAPLAGHHGSVGAALLLEHVVLQDRERVAAALQEFFGGHSVGQLEYRVLGDDQVERWIETRWSTAFAPDGEPATTFATNLDITERKQAELATRQSEERFRALVMASTDVVYRMSPDWSEMRQLLGQNFISDTTEPNRNWLQEYIHPNDQQRVMAVIHEAIRTKSLFEMEHQVVTVDGSLGWTFSRAVPMLDANGEIVEWFGTASDVTQQKLAEQALRESEHRYRSLFDSMDEGYCIVEMIFDKNDQAVDYRFLEVNSAFEQQSGMREATGKRMRELVPGHDQAWFEIYGKVALTGEAIRFTHEAKALGERWFDVYAFRFGEAENRKVAILFTNITQQHETETALRESEQRFRAVVTASTDLMCRMSPDWREMRQIYDKSFVVTTDVTNLNWLENYVYRDDQPRLMALVNEAIRNKTQFEMEHRVRLADGSWGWMLSRAVPVLDAQGELIEWFGTGSDVTERKRAEQALRESEERYRSLFNSIDEGFCLIDVLFDPHNKPVDFRFLELNPAFERQTGMQGAAGKRMRELVPDIEALWFEAYGQVALTGKACRFVNEAKPLRRWFDVYAMRVGGTDSRKVAVLFTNITERMTVEAALRRSEERFRALFDGGPVGMYSCDSAGVIQNFNRRAVELWERQPAQGETSDRFRSVFNFYLPDGTLLPPSQNPMSLILKGEVVAVRDLEVILERPDGSRIVVIVNCVALRNEQGEITGALTCFLDVTERSRLLQQTREQAQVLAELGRRKDEFLAMLSHELRNPLAAVSNAVNLLRLQQDQSPVQHQARSIIERQVGQLKHLVDDLLDVSRISTGRVQLRLEPVAVSAIVERAVETALPLITQQRHELTVAMSAEPVWLHADAARLEQVLVNLLTNAAKYTDNGGHIWLSVEQDVDSLVPMVAITVRDSGIGIAPDLLPHIFDLFTQAERSLDRSEGGLGIGLSLVQRLVELHGGVVTASSVPGQGSEFVVRLPMLVRSRADLPLVASAALSVAKAPPASALPVPSAASDSSTSPAPPAGSGCRVLLVDDNADAVQTLAMLLEMSGYAVHLAYDGLSAIEAAIAHQPDVVLLDIGLPGLNGYQAAQRIRQQATLKGVVLIALTGYGRDTDRERSQQAGFDHHLVKPASFDEIDALLRTVSARRKPPSR